MEQLNKKHSYCPSCYKIYPQEEVHFEGPILCEECIKRREKRYEHSEEDVQEKIKQQIDSTIRKSWR